MTIYPMFPSPANVSIMAFDGTATSGAHFEATNQTEYIVSSSNKITFQVSITAAAFMPEILRKGAEDDVSLNLRISEISPLHGNATVDRGTGILTIRAVCQVVSHVCIAAWDLDRVTYYRLDEL